MAIELFSSQRFGYAVHALCYMAKKPPGALTTLPELAEWLGSIWASISETYLSNVIQRLARGGVLRSHRGVAGGYSLAKPAEDLTMRDLIELLEGVALQRCSLSLEGECPVQGLCGIQRKLRRIEQDYLQALGRLSIAELAKDLKVKFPKTATSKAKHGAAG